MSWKNSSPLETETRVQSSLSAKIDLTSSGSSPFTFGKGKTVYIPTSSNAVENGISREDYLEDATVKLCMDNAS
ncbi:hypothetical protein Tco_1479644 [Tanacetum coccineum]